MFHPTIAEQLISCFAPRTVDSCATGEFMKGLTKILGACISPLYLALLTALTSHRSNPGETRQAVSIGPTVLLRAKRAE